MHSHKVSIDKNCKQDDMGKSFVGPACSYLIVQPKGESICTGESLQYFLLMLYMFNSCLFTLHKLKSTLCKLRPATFNIVLTTGLYLVE